MFSSHSLRVAFALPLLALLSCASVPRSFKERTLDDMYLLLSREQYAELESLDADRDICLFLDQFWHGQEELRSEYEQRLEYANAHFPDRRGWGRSDRKRIYLTYGPPRSIDRYENTDVKLGMFATITSLEVWSYGIPGKEDAFPAHGDAVARGERRFIFGDETGSCFFTLMYSSEKCSDIDPRLFLRQELYDW